jgi:cytoskeletal protein CcmA (bactofilin family)
MNKPVSIVIGILMMSGLSVSAQYWSSESIRGEGEVVKQQIVLPSFDGIDLAFDGEVILTPGPAQNVVIEGQQNIIDNIKREVKDGSWSISFIKNVKDAKDVKVYVTVPVMDHVGLSGSGSIRSTDKFGGLKDVELAVAGSGDIDMAIDAKTTKLRISGSGDIALAGSTGSLEIAISGSGDVTAKDLVSSACKVQISGSGDAAVHVNGELETLISGSGDVYYRGNANVTARISGSGEVEKI